MILAVSNQKGGVGKTTTVVNLAAMLGRRGFGCLVVDMDPQGNATSGFGVTPQDYEASAYEALLERVPFSEVILSTDFHVDIVPSDPDLAGAELELVSVMGRESRLAGLLEEVKGKYDYIIIDTPPTLGLLTVNALTAASELLVPLQCEYYALEGLSQLLKTVELIHLRLNPELNFLGIVLTMFDKRNNLSHQVAEEIDRHFPNKVLKTVIPRNIKLSEAPSFGSPVFWHDANSTGSKAYTQLAEEFIQLEQIVDCSTSGVEEDEVHA